MIKKMSRGSFSASGREASAVAPKGKVFYCNKEEKLSIVFHWDHAGWTSGPLTDPTASGDISGETSTLLKGSEPWSNYLEVAVEVDTWTYTLQEIPGVINRAVDAVKKAVDKGLDIDI